MSEHARMVWRAVRPHGDRRTAALVLLLMLAIAVVAGCSSHGGGTAVAVPAAVRNSDSAPLPALTRPATGWNGWQPSSPTPKPNITPTDTAGRPFRPVGQGRATVVGTGRTPFGSTIMGNIVAHDRRRRLTGLTVWMRGVPTVVDRGQ